MLASLPQALHSRDTCYDALTRTLRLAATSPMHTGNVPGSLSVSELINCSLCTLDFGVAYVLYVLEGK
jgi:hypothetical protein